MALQPLASSMADTVDRIALTFPVRRVLHRPEAEVLDWQWSELNPGVGNPVSAGIFRFTGTADDRGTIVPWTMILKVMQSPANLGIVGLGEGPDETHWNYWRREKLLFESDLLDDLPDSVRAPECYGTAELPGQIAWLWLEEISDAYDGPWPQERYELTAYHLGRFNGAYLAGKTLPRHPWLSRNFARQFVTGCRLGVIPRLARNLPDVHHHPVVQFIEECGPVLDLMDRFPQTFCHFDTGRANLMSRRADAAEPETVAIDWALAGIGPVGAELSQLIPSVGGPRQVGMALDEERLVDSYLSGLTDVGCSVDRRVVLFNYSTFMVLRLGVFLFSFMYRDLESGQEITLDDTPISILVPYIERARELLPEMQ